MVSRQDKKKRMEELAKEDTVSMTIQIPVSIHTRMKITAAEKHIGLYEMVIRLFDKSF